MILANAARWRWIWPLFRYLHNEGKDNLIFFIVKFGVFGFVCAIPALITAECRGSEDNFMGWAFWVCIVSALLAGVTGWIALPIICGIIYLICACNIEDKKAPPKNPSN